MDLAAILARDGLEPLLRHLVVAVAAIWPADWPRLRTVLTAARTAGLRREPFEEALLQATLFFGFPRLVSAFEQLTTVWPVERAPSGGGLPVPAQAAAGRALFAAIYGKNDAAVRAMLASFHAEFHDFVLEAAYGRVLTRPGLSSMQRELLAVAALAVMAQVPQLVAHARGARHFGASDADLRETLVAALAAEDRAAELLRRL